MTEAALSEAGSTPEVAPETTQEITPEATQEATPEVIENWYAGLPEEVQGWDEVRNSPDPNAFYKQMGDMRSMIGRSLQVPGPDASQEARENYLHKVMEKTPELMVRPTDENMTEVYDSLGRPEAPDKYAVPEFEADAPLDSDSINAFRPVAHEAGLSQKQFEAVVQKMTMNTAHRNEQAMQQHSEQMTALKGEWGMAYDQNVKLAEKVQKEFFPHLGLPIDKMDAHSVKSLQALGKALGSEGVHLSKDEGNNSAAMTPAEADQVISEIMANQEHPYWIAGHPGHKAAVQRVIKLHEYKNGATG